MRKHDGPPDGELLRHSKSNPDTKKMGTHSLCDFVLNAEPQIV